MNIIYNTANKDDKEFIKGTSETHEDRHLSSLAVTESYATYNLQAFKEISVSFPKWTVGNSENNQKLH